MTIFMIIISNFLHELITSSSIMNGGFSGTHYLCIVSPIFDRLLLLIHTLFSVVLSLLVTPIFVVVEPVLMKKIVSVSSLCSIDVYEISK